MKIQVRIQIIITNLNIIYADILINILKFFVLHNNFFTNMLGHLHGLYVCLKKYFINAILLVCGNHELYTFCKHAINEINKDSIETMVAYGTHFK